MKKSVPWLLLLACAAGIGGTLYLLLHARFESGDVYPPSSSLRSDPLGTMIFYESLRRLPGMTVERDHRAVNQLPDGRQTAYLHLAGESGDWLGMPKELYQPIERFLFEGGRLVIAFEPEFAERKKKADDSKPSKKKDEAKEPEKKTDEKNERDRKWVHLGEKWGIDFSREAGDSAEKVAKNVSALAFPAELKWNGDLILKDPDSSWQILYRKEKQPVLAERKFGPGSIVIATDTYFFSNEAMVRDRHPELLAWLAGPVNRVVFDEAHLGIVESPGIAALARKYRLHGGAVALLVLAGLFIWKNSRPLAPLRTADPASDVLAGRSAAAGFVNLLRRSIPADRIFSVCVNEWKKTFGHSPRVTRQEKAAVEEIARTEEALPPRERNPVAACQKIGAALRRTSF